MQLPSMKSFMPRVSSASMAWHHRDIERLSAVVGAPQRCDSRRRTKNETGEAKGWKGRAV